MLNVVLWRRPKMDRRTEWPWSLEEEAEWKAELEERDQDFVEELIGESVEDDLSGSRDVIGTPEKEPADSIPEKYLVTA
jgi:hypothetical protein